MAMFGSGSPYLTTTLADASKMPQQEQAGTENRRCRIEVVSMFCEEAARLGAMRLAVAQSRPPPAAKWESLAAWPGPELCVHSQ